MRTWIGIAVGLAVVAGIVLLSNLGGCFWLPSSDDLEAVVYTPLSGDDWTVSTPEAQGLNPMLVAKLYYNAAELETLYGLLVIKNGFLIAEGYFNEGSTDQLSGRQSVTKSVTSALVGIAIDQGCLSSVDQRMIDFFPELAGQVVDPRKEQITIQHLLQMRGGYPDEERTPPYLDALYFSDNWHWMPHIVDFPLVSAPGTRFNYSNLTSHLLGAIVTRACETDLMSYANEHLFSPIGAAVGDWTTDADGYNFGCIEIYLTARDMAKFGLLYLNGGKYEGNQILQGGWVRQSLQMYSEGINFTGWLSSRFGSFHDLGYGYQWWSGRVGDHHFNYASGHGGQYIILLQDLDMVIVTTADPLYGPDLASGGGWKFEKPINRLVGEFIESLP
ncbi:serine hydrolase domain-containing protein [Candidatus Bipolaricaulota bacterium]